MAESLHAGSMIIMLGQSAPLEPNRLQFIHFVGCMFNPSCRLCQLLSTCSAKPDCPSDKSRASEEGEKLESSNSYIGQIRRVQVLSFQ